MRIRHVGMLAAVWTAVGLGAVRGGDSPAEKQGPPIRIIASSATLKVGTHCHVALKPVTMRGHDVSTEYSGVITRADDQGIELTVTDERRVSAVKPLGSRPLLGRFFRNIGIVPLKPGEPKAVWLPSDRIDSVRLAEKAPAAQVPVRLSPSS